MSTQIRTKKPFGRGLSTSQRLVMAVIIAGSVLYIVMALYSRDLFWLLNVREHYMVARLSPGTTSEEVKTIFGDPERVYAEKLGQDSYYVKGYSFKERAITKEVWIYFGWFDVVVYVYFDNDMKVEDVFMGFS